MRMVLLIVLAIVLALNVKATLALLRSPYYSQKQMLFQLALVWALPVVGALLVWALASESKSALFTTHLQDYGGYDDGRIKLNDASMDGGGDGGDGGGD